MPLRGWLLGCCPVRALRLLLQCLLTRSLGRRSCLSRVQVKIFPVFTERAPVSRLVLPRLPRGELYDGRAFRAQAARLTGESGSPSIWVTFPFRTWTSCPQPTAQYAHAARTTVSAAATVPDALPPP